MRPPVSRISAECVHLCSSSLGQIITYLKKLSTVCLNCPCPSGNQADFNFRFTDAETMHAKDQMCIYLRTIIYHNRH